MASPQPDRHTRFSNELFEKYISIVKYLSPYENCVWLCIFRKTYGYNKKTDWISLNQIGEMTSINRVHVARSLKKLKEKNMIVHLGIKGKVFSTGIQKDYDMWLLPKQVVPKQVTVLLPQQVTVLLPKQDETVTQTGFSLLPKQVLTKDITTKDIKTDTSFYDFEAIWAKYPDRVGKKSAERHFNASVKTEQAWKDINTALSNYLLSKRVLKGFVQNGSTWFNDWEGWVKHKKEDEVW